MEFKIKNKGQARIFRNGTMELFTKTSPQVIYSMYLPVVIGLLAYSIFSLHAGGLRVVANFFGGMFFWTLFEYLMHRFVFHHQSDHPKLQRITYTAHGVHHEFPRDKNRLFMPPVPSLIVATIVFTIFYLVIHYNTFMFFPGFLLGYLLYGSMHYAIHAMAPPFRFMKAWWRYHHLHHYREPGKGFGVSSPLWDHVFGTLPRHEGAFDNPEEL